MTFGHAFEDSPEVWGVGRLLIDGIVTPWPVAQADIEDEAESLAPRLTALGLEPGGLVLIASMLSQAIHVVPIEKAAGKVGGLYSSADATPFDAFRVASLVRQLDAQVVMGVSGAVLDGLEGAGTDLQATFGGLVSVVTVDTDAHARLCAAGLAPRRWVKLGPTSAIEADDGLRYDETRWQVDADDGELVVTNVVPRLTPCDRLPTGVRGQVLEPGLLAFPVASTAG